MDYLLRPYAGHRVDLQYRTSSFFTNSTKLSNNIIELSEFNHYLDTLNNNNINDHMNNNFIEEITKANFFDDTINDAKNVNDVNDTITDSVRHTTINIMHSL